MIKKISSLVVTLGLAVLFVAPVYAQTSNNNVNNVFGNGAGGNSGTAQQTSNSSSGTGGQNNCGTTKTQLVSCGNAQTGVGTINSLISIGITVLSVMIGVVAVGGLAYAAILYASARDDQSQVSNARTIIRNIVIGIILYVFTIALINWLIPGGVISGGGQTPTTSDSPSPSITPGTVTPGQQ